MKYWIALESLVLPDTCTKSKEKPPIASEGIRADIRTRIIDLYTKILNLQIRSVLRTYSSTGRVLLRDVLRRDDWKGMKTTIESLESGITNDLQTANGALGQQNIKELNETTLEILQNGNERLDLARHQVYIAGKQLRLDEKRHQLSAEALERQMAAEEDRCLQIFRVSDYEACKNRISPRHDGTCQWLLKSWLTSTHTCPLLVTADPGCGKSVLTRHIVDHELPESTTICYFFFNDQSQNRVDQALCALLHQLLSQRLILIKHAMDKFASDGEKLPDMTSSLWVILGNAIRDKEAGDVIFVVDVLDECSHSDLPDFMRNIRNLFNDDQEMPSFKFFSTGRPYEWVTRQFRDLAQEFPTIRIPGEDEEHTGLISQDIDAVIKSRVNSLANKLVLKEELKDHLSKKLCEIKHRTYLWIHLVFWFLEEHSFHKTMKGIDAAVAKLPNRDTAYERILELSTNPGKARKVMSIMLAVKVPLSLKELQIAVSATPDTLCANDLDLEDEDDFYMTLRG